MDVTNSGKVAGEEGVQLYIADKSSSDPRPIKDLRGFERISLDAGETKTVQFELSSKDLAYWNVDQHDYVPTTGSYDIMVGSSSADQDLTKVMLKVN